jgi:hypothetical protein
MADWSVSLHSPVYIYIYIYIYISRVSAYRLWLFLLGDCLLSSVSRVWGSEDGLQDLV